MNNHKLEVSIRTWEWGYSNMGLTLPVSVYLTTGWCNCSDERQQTLGEHRHFRRGGTSCGLCSTQGYIVQHGHVGRVWRREQLGKSTKSLTSLDNCFHWQKKVTIWQQKTEGNTSKGHKSSVGSSLCQIWDNLNINMNHIRIRLYSLTKRQPNHEGDVRILKINIVKWS